MKIEAPAHEIGLVWELLKTGRCETRDPRRVTKRAKSIADDGFASKDHIEEMLFDLGLPWEIGRSAARFLGLELKPMFHRPGRGCTSTFGIDYVSAANLAAVAIRLERLGFAADPLPLVNAVRPSLVKRKVLTLDELAVYWFAKERHRNEPVILAMPDAHTAGPWDEVRTTLPTGYKAFPTFQGEQITALEVVAPRYRSRKSGWLQ